MTKSYHIRCPKCNNDHSFYRYGKKIPMGIRSISAEPANINLHPNNQEHGKSIVGSIKKNF